MKTKTLQQLQDLKDFAQHEILPLINPGVLFLLEGDLGAGKTTLVTCIGELLGINKTALSSPTYSIIQEYKPDKIEKLNESQRFSEGLEQIFHIDLYRLESPEEIESSGLWDLFHYKNNSILFIEWPSRVRKEDWPLDWQIYHINLIKKDDLREIQLNHFF